jgi:translation initiation factor 1
MSGGRSVAVYSSGAGRLCAGCGAAVGHCVCRAAATVRPGDGIVRVGRETKGRKGKGVTVITGLPLAPAALLEIAKDLKARCGCGGTVRGGVVEIQGDHRDRLLEELGSRGYRVKRVGG